MKRAHSVKIMEEPTSSYPPDGNLADAEDTTSPESQGPRDCSSIYSIPASSVPPRASSQNRDPAIGLQDTLTAFPVPPRGKGYTIPNRGQSRSPVRAAKVRHDPVASDTSRRIPSRTFVRSPCSADILDYPTHRHPRVSVDLQLLAPLFVGGGGIKGSVRVVVDDAERIRQRRQLAIARISIDLLGSEQISSNRKSIFLSLGTELLDSDHPPPADMVESIERESPQSLFWTLAPSQSTLPFMISLPLDTGPPPFQSKHARIRYILSATLLVRDAGKPYLVRTSQEISVLSTYDRESRRL